MAEPERQQQSKIPSIIVECLWAGLFLGVAYLSAQQAWKIHRSPDDFEINVDSFFDGVWEKISYPGHYVVNQLAIYQSSEKREKRNPLAENPAEYLKVLAEIENHCSEKDQSCGPNLNLREREKIANSVRKVTKYNPANRFAQIIKHYVIKRKTKKPGKMTMKQKAKIAARQKLRERKELEKKLGIPESDIAYDLEAYMKNKPLIKKNRASARKLKEYQEQQAKVMRDMELRNQTETEQEYHVFMASFSLTFSVVVLVYIFFYNSLSGFSEMQSN